MAIPSHSWRTGARYLGIRGVCERYSISPRTVWRWIRKGILPEPIYFDGASSGGRWQVDELDRRDAERESLQCDDQVAS